MPTQPEEVQPDGLGVAAQRCALCKKHIIRDDATNGTEMWL